MQNIHCLNYLKVIFLMLATCSQGCRKSDVPFDAQIHITDNGIGTGTTTWTSDREYLLDGFVFVNDGQILTIEPGTIIQATTGQKENASALIVARGGKIIAKGTSDQPIIFTVEGDDLQGSVPLLSRGLWGGVILLGNAPLNVEGNEAHIEGIPLSEPRGVYGGNIPDDNSGIFQYVSIRHGGTNIGEGNEINGLTLGGVGNATIIDHVEIISNEDDGIEFFGGTVNARYIVVAYCGDDAFDFDFGYQGKGQFWLAVQDPAVGDKIAEHTGGGNGVPYTIPVIYNITCIGRGTNTNKPVLEFKDNAAGKYYNSLFVSQDIGIGIEYTPYPLDSYWHLLSRNIEVSANAFFNVRKNDTLSIFYPIGSQIPADVYALCQSYFNENGNLIENTGIGIIGQRPQWIPIAPINTGMAIYNDPWFEPVEFMGAFGDSDWTEGWTLLNEVGTLE